ncbi:hypothetical protein psal_cds_290 [Pandoravirus salinus]|uniref:Uncharacterized protein n=1 Tax=Pandoravirus salinus TaxID=1349410 RepID=S4W0I0_9VIRU|nr:hypothetical protein psal_cds_290 [Pandoravirus salinus]AGO83882.1 hypothetical protein psal_cds_290 [Pandoravirus salinus]
MEVFAPDPVDEMAARVHARWSAADRRRANVAWWCPDTATVPRTPPSVLMDALAGEFDAYAAHRRTIDCAAAVPDATCQQAATLQAPADLAATATARSSSGTATRPRTDRTRLCIALAVGAAAVLLVLLLVGLALGPVWRARNQAVTVREGNDDDDGDSPDGVPFGVAPVVASESAQVADSRMPPKPPSADEDA